MSYNVFENSKWRTQNGDFFSTRYPVVIKTFARAAQSVPQILKNHGFIIAGENQVLIKRYSNDINGTL